MPFHCSGCNFCIPGTFTVSKPFLGYCDCSRSVAPFWNIGDIWSVRSADRVLIYDGGTSTLFTHHRPVLNSTAEGVVGAFHVPGRKAKQT